MGASAQALTRLWRRHGWSIDTRYLWEAAIDGLFACANSVGAVAERLVYGRAARHTNVTRPVFILGHWRTGTTWLHDLLHVDTRLRCPTTYECFVPHHFLLTQRGITALTRFAIPRTRAFDNMALGWDRPQEDEFALVNLGLPSPYTRIAFPNGTDPDQAWLDLDGLSDDDRAWWEATLLDYCRRLLLAQPGRLVLKSPPHTCRVPTLLRVFPDARFIYLVRNPRQVIPSTERLWRSLFATYAYQRSQPDDLRSDVLQRFAHFHTRFETTRSLIPDGRLSVVRYEDFAASPETTLQIIYEQLDLGDFATIADSVRALVVARSTYRPNRHELDAELSEAIERTAADYSKQYGY